MRDRQDGRVGEDLAGFLQRKQEAAAGAFDGQPRDAARLSAHGLEPLGQPGLEFAQGFLCWPSMRSDRVGRRAAVSRRS